MKPTLFFQLALAGFALVASPVAARTPTPAEQPAPLVTLDYYRLENGLKVVLAPDANAPTTTVAVYYGIGWRIEPKGRTGFAHLFEHLMFQGSANLPKGEYDKLISGNGGSLNGSTRWDYTNYYQVVPSHVTQTVLWAEADRMKSLAITADNLKNQQDVVKNEVKVNVLNQPYGAFVWLDMPQVAFSNFYNAHNFYGDLEEIDAATLDQAKAFHETYYTPNNAVLVVAGDMDKAQVKSWVQTYFGNIPARPRATLPDLSEPPQTAEKRAERTDPLAPKPGLQVAWRVPPRHTDDFYAMGLIEDLLSSGDDSRLVQRLVRDKGLTDSVSGGINPFLGSQFSYNGPMLMTYGLIHDASVAPEMILKEIDAVIEDLRTKPVPESDLKRIRTQLRSSFYDLISSSNRFGLVDLLASFALFDDDPGKINTIEARFAAITPEQVRKTAAKYLARDQRTILIVKPGAEPHP